MDPELLLAAKLATWDVVDLLVVFRNVRCLLIVMLLLATKLTSLLSGLNCSILWLVCWLLSSSFFVFLSIDCLLIVVLSPPEQVCFWWNFLNLVLNLN